MQQQRRRWQKALAVFALLLACLVLWLRTERAGEFVCGQLRTRLPEIIDASVLLGRCEIDPLILAVRVHDVSVTQHGAESPMVSAEEARVSLRGVFFGGVSLQEVALVKPRVDIVLPQPRPDDAATKRVCPLDLLARIRVQSIEVQDGVMQLQLPSGQRIRADGLQVLASLRKAGADIDLSMRGGSLVLDEKRQLAVGRVSLDGTLDVRGQKLTIRRAGLNIEGVNASVSGSVTSLCDALPHLALNTQVYVPMAALPRFGVKLEPAPTGQVWSRVSVTGRVDAPVVRAELQASQIAIGPFTPGDFSARVALSGNELEIEEFVTTAGEGEVRLSGNLSLTAGLPLHLKLETREASFANIMDRAGVTGSWVEFPASLKATVSGKLLPVPALAGDVDFRTGPFALASHAYDAPATPGTKILNFQQSAGTFRLAVNESSVAFNEATVSVGPEGHTKVTGTVKIFFDQTKGLDIRAVASSLDLSDFKELAGLPISGFGQAKISVFGAGKDIAIEGQTTLRDFKLQGYSLGIVQSAIKYANDTLSFPGIAAQKGHTQYFGDVSLGFAPEGLYARASVQLPDGRLEDVIDLLADLSPAIQTIQGPLLGHVSAVASIDSPAKELNGLIVMQLRDVSYYARALGAANAVLRFDHGEGLVLEPLRFAGPAGALAINGTWKFAGPLDFRASLTQGVLQELLDPSNELPITGVVSAEAKVGGDTDVIRVDATVSSDDIRYKARSLGPSSLKLKLLGTELAVQGQVMTGVTVSSATQIVAEWPTSAKFKVELDDASLFLPSSAGMSLIVNGDVSATGPLQKVEQMRALAKLNRVVLSRGDVSASNVEPIEVGYNAGAIEVTSLAMKGPTTEFHAEGRWGPSSVDLRTSGNIDLRLLSSFVSAIERTQGRLDFTAGFAGSVKNPAVVGSAEVTDVRLSVKGQDLAVRALSGHADFSESRVLLQDVQGFLNDGRLRMRGDARLEKLAIKTLELQADLEDVSVQVQPDIPATFSGSLLLASKTPGAYQLSGAIDVVKFRYTEPLSLDSLLANARDRSVPQDEVPHEWLKLDVDIATGKDVRIENNLARARLLGKVKLTGTNVKPVLIGAIEVGEGAQAYFRGNTFSMSRGVLQFNGLWPAFDLSAQSQVRGYLVNVKAFGRFEDPKISLTSEPALSEADVISLLTLGVTTRERFDGTSGAGLAAEALLSASGLDQQVQRFLARNVGLKDQQVRFTTSFNEATGTAEPSVTWESKVLNDNLKIGVTQPVTGRGTQAQAEYRFNPRVSARAQWDNQTQNTTIGNPGVNLRFRFEWE